MEILLIVAAMGAVVGLAFTLFDFSWATVRFFSGWFDVHPATMLVLSAIGGAVIISVEFWLATILWQALN
jgi:hypothetical protein